MCITRGKIVHDSKRETTSYYTCVRCGYRESGYQALLALLEFITQALTYGCWCTAINTYEIVLLQERNLTVFSPEDLFFPFLSLWVHFVSHVQSPRDNEDLSSNTANRNMLHCTSEQMFFKNHSKCRYNLKTIDTSLSTYNFNYKKMYIIESTGCIHE